MSHSPLGLAPISAIAALLAAAGATVAQQPFTIAVLPDTQFYSANTTGINGQFFAAQTRWVVNNAPAWNIVFCTHLGDVVDTAGAVGNPSGQWSIAVPAMAILRNSLVPYSILPGNHDWTSAGGSGSLEHYRPRFGDTSGFFSGKPWFVGFDPRGINTAQRFSTPIGDMLHIGLEWNAVSPAVSSDRPGATANPIAWAQSVIDANPGVPTIVSTHNHINTAGVRDAAGQQLFARLVAPNDQIFLVLGGHYSSQAVTERLLTSTNNDGRVVYEMLTDYQARNRGGDGWLRLLAFDAANDRISAHTYTPIADAALGVPAGPEYGGTGRVELDADSRFDLPIDFAQRFTPLPPPPPPPPAPEGVVFTLKQGLNGYSGTHDNEVRRNQPAAVLGDQGYMHIDTDEGGAAPSFPAHGLLRFDGLFGPGPDQVGPDRAVLNARLRLYPHPERGFSDGSGFEVRRVLVPWTEATTWDAPALAASGAGVGTYGSSGVEALADADAAAGLASSNVGIPSGVWLDLPVTRSLRSFEVGAPNHGWLLQAYPNTTNATRVESSESELQGGHFPELVITQTRDAVITRTFTTGVDTHVESAAPTVVNGSAPTIVVDAATDNANPDSADTQGLVRFPGLFGPHAAQVAPGALVASAVLELHVNADIEFHAGGGFTVNRMLRPWGAADTWSSLDGGVSADGYEASRIPDDTAGRENAASPFDTAYVRAGVYFLDVTDSVRRWSAAGGEATNHGWALLPLPSATNAVIFDSFDSTLTSALPPRLTVRFVPCRADADASGGAPTVADIFAFLGLWFAADTRGDFDRSGAIDVADIFAFLSAWFSGC